MWQLLALAAALLTSTLPILNKRLLADAPVSVVVWAVNFFSLPVLGAAAFVFWPPATVDSIFWLGVTGSALLNLVAAILSTQALKWADASLVTPLLTFNPAFTLLVGAVMLGEQPTHVGILGVLLVIAGAYVLSAPAPTDGWWPGVKAFFEPAKVLAVVASLVWGLTPIAEKLAIEHSQPMNPPAVAFGTTALMSVLLLPSLLRPGIGVRNALRGHPKGFVVAALVAGVAPVFGFSAIAAGPVGYVTAIFKLSSVFTVVLAIVFLGERGTRARLVGSAVMAAGAWLIAG